MPETRAQYSCDACHSRKVACSRDQTGCQRCKSEGVTCKYSRSGVIRRKRKQNDQQQSSVMVEVGDIQRRPQSFPDPTDASAHVRLQRLLGRDNRSLGVFASLLEEHAAAWQDSSAFDALAEGAQHDYFQFEDGQVRAWFHVFIETLHKEKLMLPPSQSDLLQHVLAPDLPYQNQNRAWLVMFYAITLSSTSTRDTTTTNLRSNLWLAFNDVRLLLEPAIPNIQALIILVSYAEQFMSPSICWMLVSKACVMLQAIGVTHARSDTSGRELPNMLFWRLNTLDKSLALILRKPPTISPEVAAGFPLPPLEQLLQSLPGHSFSGLPALFNAHYIHQMHLMSTVMAKVWSCLYGQDSQKVAEVTEGLETWHRQATEVLEAAALAEKPFLQENVSILVDFGLETLHYYYYYLSVLIRVSNRQSRTQSTNSAMKLLRLLPSLGNKARYLKLPYCCLLWQLLHYPLVAFGSLWGEIVVKRESDPQKTQQELEAIECFPPYMLKLGSRNPLANKLAHIAEKIVQNIHSIISAEVENNQIETPQNPTNPLLHREPSGKDKSYQQHNILNMGATIETPGLARDESNVEFQPDSLFASDDGFLNATIDWFTWANEDLSALDRQSV